MRLLLLFLLLMTTMQQNSPAEKLKKSDRAASDIQSSTTRDPRVRTYVLPSRIVWKSSQPGAIVENVDALLKPVSGQVTLSNHIACSMRNESSSPGILLDFGKELSGGVQISVSDLHPVGNNGKTVKLRVRFGESVSEAMSELGEKGSQTDHAVRDSVVQAPWLGTVEVGKTGFRVVRVDLVEAGASIAIKSVRAIFLHRDLPYLGSFKCSDQLLNKIWLTGAYTVQLNMQDYLWDGVKRDRLVWIGDMHPETMTISTVFGQHEIVPHSLDLIRDETPVPQWMNGISSYSMWWVLIQRSWYLHSGDKKYLKQQHPYLKALLKNLATYVGANNQETLPEGRFLDWPSSENSTAIHAGLHSLLILTLSAGAEMCAELEDTKTQAKCTAAVERLRKYIPDPNNSKQAAALMALAGLGDAKKLNKSILSVDGAARYSTFYGYYVLQAKAKAEDYKGALDAIRSYWGGMLSMGATTFWEDFNLDWMANSSRIDELPKPGQRDIHGDFGAYCYMGFRHSLCHGWSSGPTPWLSEHVLGIEIVEPGCKVMRIKPHLGDLAWAEGDYPTPLGILHVRAVKQANGTVKTSIKAPKGMKLLR